jgi:23S rRNA (uracil1939-C5)-methyltransferase
VAVGQITKVVGPGYLDETSLGITYRISPFSFFQTNTLHLPNLITRALDRADLRPTDVVWDLYCGTGTLTLPAAQRAKHVIGAELSESSIADARANAERNSINNVAFHTVDLHVPSAMDVLRSLPQPDVILIDPPRNGMHEQVVRHILAVAPERLIYVSCNPATMARDCAILAELYDVVEVTPVDMFPQTYHVEAVGVLRRR